MSARALDALDDALLDLGQLERDVLRMLPAFSGVLGQAPGHEPAERGRRQRLACRERRRLVLEDRRHQRSLRI